MWIYVARRVLLAIPTFVVATMIVFLIIQKAPGGPVERAILQMQMGAGGGGEGGGGAAGLGAEGGVSERAIEELKRYYDLDKPIHVRYVSWLWKVARLDLGKSYKYEVPVTQLLRERFPVSISIGLIAFLLTYSICIPLGITKAIRHGSLFDFGSSALVFMGYSIPGWALGLLLLLFLGSPDWGLEWFPMDGIRPQPAVWDTLDAWGRLKATAHRAFLPIVAYMAGSFATLTILSKNSLMENLGQDYVRTAFAKGLGERRVIVVHAMRNSLIPLATGLGHVFSLVLAGSYLIEKVFQIPGMGMLGYNAIVDKDQNIVMGIMVLSTALNLFGNIMQDVLYAVFDPRIRFR